MANTNLLSTAEIKLILDTPLWAGQGGITKVNTDGAIISSGDTSWHPTGSGSAANTISLGIVEVIIDDGDAASGYDLALATNPITGTEIIAVLGIHCTSHASANAVPVAGNVSTTSQILWTGAGTNGVDTTYRLAFLYR